MGHRTKAETGGGLTVRLGEVGRDVRASLLAVLEPVGGSKARPSDVCKAFGVNKSVASRLLKGLGTSDPAAALGVLPGPEALRAVVRSATEAHTPPRARAEAAIDDLDHLIRVETGGRDGLTALLSESVPELRDRFELGHKQAAHRAMANLMGFSADAYATSLIVWPNAQDPSRLDALDMIALHGLRLRRPGCRLAQVDRFFSPDPTEDPRRTLRGEVPKGPEDLILWERTTLPRDQIRVHRAGACHTLDLDLGPLQGDGYDLTVAMLRRAVHFAQPREGRSAGVGLTVGLPARLGVVEILMVPGVWEGRTARTMTHMLGSLGAVDPNDVTRDTDLLRVTERVESIGWDQMRIAEIPDHPSAVELVCGATGVDARTLRGFRVRASYPVVGTQLSLDLPPA